MAKQTISREWNEADQSIVATLGDGSKLTFSYSALPDPMKIACGMHGMEQKIFDSIAGMTKAGETQEAITAELKRVYDNLLAEEWTGKRGSSEVSLTLLAEAISRVLNKPLEAVTAFLGTMATEQVKALRGDANIKAAIDQIKAERSAAKAASAGATSLEALKGLLG